MVERIPDALAGAMGNQMYLATFDTQEELDAFYADVVKCREDSFQDSPANPNA